MNQLRAIFVGVVSASTIGAGRPLFYRVGAPAFQPGSAAHVYYLRGMVVASVRHYDCGTRKESVCVLRFWPQADNAVTLGEGGGFILPAFTGAVPLVSSGRDHLISVTSRCDGSHILVTTVAETLASLPGGQCAAL